MVDSVVEGIEAQLDKFALSTVVDDQKNQIKTEIEALPDFTERNDVKFFRNLEQDKKLQETLTLTNRQGEDLTLFRRADENADQWKISVGTGEKKEEIALTQYKYGPNDPKRGALVCRKGDDFKMNTEDAIRLVKQFRMKHLT